MTAGDIADELRRLKFDRDEFSAIKIRRGRARLFNCLAQCAVCVAPRLNLQAIAMTTSDYLTIADYFALAVIVVLGCWAAYMFTRRRS
jgi:hypothetical protein